MTVQVAINLQGPMYNENDNSLLKHCFVFEESRNRASQGTQPLLSCTWSGHCLYSRPAAGSTSFSFLCSWPGNCLQGSERRELESYVSPFSAYFVFFLTDVQNPAQNCFLLPCVSCLSYLIFSGRRLNLVCVSASCTEAEICSVPLFKDPSRCFFLFGLLAWYLVQISLTQNLSHHLLFSNFNDSLGTISSFSELDHLISRKALLSA